MSSLRIDLGGVTSLGNLEIDNLLGPVDPPGPDVPSNDDFDLLTINSFLANSSDHFLLPDEWIDLSPLPSDRDTASWQAQGPSLGDITGGDDRGVLNDICIHLQQSEDELCTDPAAAQTGAASENPQIRSCESGVAACGRRGPARVLPALAVSQTDPPLFVAPLQLTGWPGPLEGDPAGLSTSASRRPRCSPCPQRWIMTWAWSRRRWTVWVPTHSCWGWHAI